MKHPDWQRAAAESLHAHDVRWTALGASAWGESFACETASQRYFVKIATGENASTIDCEADGLRAIASTQTIRVPSLATTLECDRTRVLVLEWLDFGHTPKGTALARAIAALHRAPVPRGPNGERFGWTRDNWIGGTPQQNRWSDDWCAFFRNRRLAPQLRLAQRNGFAELRRDGERLLRDLAALFDGHDPQPSLLHGDLWSGNATMLADGTPAIFDPAVYIGDREADIAMTELFGGFAPDFYIAYNDACPLPAGYPLRRDIYNLYHVLNHANLFGGGYVAQAQSMVRRLLKVL